MKFLRTPIKMLMLATVVLASCSKDDAKPRVKDLPAFTEIEAQGAITIDLVSGASNKVTATSLKDEGYSVTDGKLLVYGDEGSTISITINKTDLIKCGGCTIRNAAAIATDTLTLEVTSGTVNLTNLSISHLLDLTASNTGDYYLSGTASDFKLTNNYQTHVNAFDLVAENVTVMSWNDYETDIYATKLIDITIGSSGDVWFKGGPDTILVTQSGTGKAVATK